MAPGDFGSMMVIFDRSMIAGEAGEPATATTAPHPEWTRTPMAADFINEYFTPGQGEAVWSFAMTDGR